MRGSLKLITPEHIALVTEDKKLGFMVLTADIGVLQKSRGRAQWSRQSGVPIIDDEKETIERYYSPKGLVSEPGGVTEGVPRDDWVDTPVSTVHQIPEKWQRGNDWYELQAASAGLLY